MNSGQDCSTDILPERVEVIMKFNADLDVGLIKCDRSGGFKKLIWVTARILSLRERRGSYSFLRIARPNHRIQIK